MFRLSQTEKTCRHTKIGMQHQKSNLMLYANFDLPLQSEIFNGWPFTSDEFLLSPFLKRLLPFLIQKQNVPIFSNKEHSWGKILTSQLTSNGRLIQTKTHLQLSKLKVFSLQLFEFLTKIWDFSKKNIKKRAVQSKRGMNGFG